MSKITVMRSNFDRTDWKRAFANALLQLWPEMNPDRAVELSDAEYPNAKNQEPAAAARRWVERQSDGQATDDATPSSSVG